MELVFNILYSRKQVVINLQYSIWTKKPGMGDKTQSYIEKDRLARAVHAPSRPTQWPEAVWRRAKCI